MDKLILKNKISDLFNNRWESRLGDITVTVHVGPTNSGKTYAAVEEIKRSSGVTIYLCPLRILANEIYDKLNTSGFPCSLVTGEEIQKVAGAKITSATIEMFDSNYLYDVIVIDECHMLADKQRGWAWTRAIVFARCKNLHLIVSNHGKDLLLKLLNKIGYQYKIQEYARLSELKLVKKVGRIDQPRNQSVFIAFSRVAILTLKNYFEAQGKKVSVIYGALPPEVRRKQAERFLTGETQICVASDSIGLGVNVPAKIVCFTELQKFDGESVRDLLPEEVQQIAGRAGRYKEDGLVTTAIKADFPKLELLFNSKPKGSKRCFISPEKEDLLEINGNISKKLSTWESLNAIPKNLLDIFKMADLTPQKTLANMLGQKNENFLGFDKSLLLVKAPANRETYDYWLKCIKELVKNNLLPVPKECERTDLDSMETLVKECEIYSWISNHQEFSYCCKDKNLVTDMKHEFSEAIDQLLMKKFKFHRKCNHCGKKLPPLHKFSICDECYYGF